MIVRIKLGQRCLKHLDLTLPTNTSRSPRKDHYKNRELHQVDYFLRFGNFNHPKLGLLFFQMVVSLTSRKIPSFGRWCKSWSKNLYPKRFYNAGHEFLSISPESLGWVQGITFSFTHLTIPQKGDMKTQNCQVSGPFFSLVIIFLPVMWFIEWVRQFRSQAKQLGLCVLFFCFGSFLCGLIIPKTQLLGPWKRSCRILSLRGDFFVWRGWMGGMVYGVGAYDSFL